MPDREKVIKGLDCCIANRHNNCPYKSIDKGIDKVTSCTTYLMKDAIAMLEDQEPRVLTLGEVMQSPDRLMWLQYKSANASDGYELHPTAPYGDDDPTWNRVTFQSGHIQTRGLYGRQWRCWTAKPDKERAGKWDG